MLAPTRDQSTSRRKGRVYGANEPHGARSSAASLASNATNVSANSLATVTPDSYLMSRQPARRKRRNKRRNSHDVDLEQPIPEINNHPRNISVFEFLVEESKPEISQTQSIVEKQLQPDQPQLELSQSEEIQTEPSQAEEPQSEHPQPAQSQPEDLEPTSLDLEVSEPRFEVSEPDDAPVSERESESEPKLELEHESKKLTPRQPEDAQLQLARLQIEQLEIELSKIEQIQPEMVALNSLVPSASDTDSLQVYKPPHQTTEVELEGYYKSQLSDSGISMGSSFSDAQQDSFHKHPLPPLMEEAADYSSYGDYLPYAPSVIDPYYHHEPQLWGNFRAPGYVPEPMPMSPASIRSYPHPYEHTHQSTPDPPSMEESEYTCLDTAPLIFKEKKSKDNAQPHMFRSFAHLNARVLLQMQSNITDLEEELALLDAKSVSADSHRRSKRGESHHFRNSAKDQSLRAEIYQELHTSLEQYYDTLSSFNQVKQMASPCDAADKNSLRLWLQTHVLPSSKIESLIGDGTDLVRIKTSDSKKSDGSLVRLDLSENKTPDDTIAHLGPSKGKIPDEALRIIAYCVLTNIFAPLLLFKFASSILSRLILLSFTTIITTLILDRHHNNAVVEISDLYWQCIMGCAGVSLFAAILF